MERTVQRFNYNSQALIKEKQTLSHQISKFEEKLASLSIQTPPATPQLLTPPTPAASTLTTSSTYLTTSSSAAWTQLPAPPPQHQYL